MGTKYHDRFSKAFDELNDKNAFVCSTCGSTDIRHATEDDRNKRMGKKEQVRKEENVSLHIARSKAEKAIYDDPSPLGP